MTLPLFIYGTLRNSDVRHAVFQTSGQSQNEAEAAFTFEEAVLTDYAVYHVAGTAYPMLVEEVDAQATGLCWSGLTDDQLGILDRFEGKHYRRIPVSITLSVSKLTCMAEIYMPDAKLPKGPAWHLETWQETGLSKFLTEDFNLAGVRTPPLSK